MHASKAVCKPHSPDLKRGALATDARGCSLWRSLLEGPPPALASRFCDPLGELERTRVGGVTHNLDKIILIIYVSLKGRSVNVCKFYANNVLNTLFFYLSSSYFILMSSHLCEYGSFAVTESMGV